MTSNGIPTAAVVAGDKPSSYGMFEAQELTAQGAFLVGSLLLELHELVTIELTLVDGSSVRVKARVERVEQGENPGVRVAFTEQGDESRDKLTSAAGE